VPGREIDQLDNASPSANPQPAPLVFRYPRNWTAVAFFGALGCLHLSMATTALLHYRWEAHMSVVFGTLFLLVAIACVLVRHEVIVLSAPERRRVLVRTSLGRVTMERATPFAAVSLVRVTLLGRAHSESCVSIVCAHDEIEMPPTKTPRQEALLLAMTMDVRLVKVYGEGPPPEPAERIANLYRNEDAV
jgi:hypothetical protein